MYLVNHGGFCCGIKTIYGMTGKATGYCDKLPGFNSSNMMQADVNTFANRAILDDIPRETKRKRLQRYIDEMSCGGETSGIIEIVLAGYQIAGWKAHLEKVGFKEVNSHLNSNSDNTIHIFHLNYGDE